MKKIELKLNTDGRRWDLVRGGKVLQTHATIKAAMDAKFDMTHKAVK